MLIKLREDLNEIKKLNENIQYLKNNYKEIEQKDLQEYDHK